MDGEPKYNRVQELRAPNETTQEYSSLWENDTNKGDSVDLKSNTSAGARSHTWKQSVQRNAQDSLQAIPPFWQHTAWPMIKKIRVKKEQIFAFAIIWICAIVPFIVLGYATAGDTFFGGVFVTKYLPCGDGTEPSIADEPVNNTVSGIEGLFVLDATYGRFPFSTVKIIDITWDIILGRGAQLFAWWISYKVFSDAILRVIERHPTSYGVFFEICLNGPCFAALWTMLKDLTRTKSKRTWSLYFYMVWSIVYVIALPILLSAMTGYTSTSIAWVDVDDTNEIIPASKFVYSSLLYSAGNHTFSEPKCMTSKQAAMYSSFEDNKEMYCDCRLSNGTITTYKNWRSGTKTRTTYSNSTGFYLYPNHTLVECDYEYPGQMGTFNITYMGDTELFSCNETYSIVIEGTRYSAPTLNVTGGYCNGDRAYTSGSLRNKARCLPDTQNLSYRWGFSTMLSGVFVIVNLVWSLTMYVVWQDAQFNSVLVRKGYTMTPLRAAFTLATVARRKIGCGNADLVRADTKDLERKLFGNSSRKIRHRGAEVGYGVFDEHEKNGWEKVSDTESGLRHRHSGGAEGPSEA